MTTFPNSEAPPQPSYISYHVPGRYRSQHLRSLCLAVETIVRKQGEGKFAGLRSAGRKENAGKCDVCGEACAGMLNSAACLLCETLVHRSCYRGSLLLKSTWDRWLCDRCFICGLSSLPPSPLCLLCQQSDGALKWTSGLGWIHPACVLLSPNVQFEDPTYSSAHGKSDSWRESKCCYCGKTNAWTVKCAEKRCLSEFHAKCALKCSKSTVPVKESENLRCIAHNPTAIVPQKSAFIAQNIGKSGEVITSQLKTYFIDAGEELEVVTVPNSEQIQFKIEPAVPGKSKARGGKAKVRVETKVAGLLAPQKVTFSPRKTKHSSSAQRIFFSSLQKETQITSIGTSADLQSKLKAFLRTNQRKADYNFYDISHLPELAKMIGRDGKVEHSSLEAIVLANSYVVG